MPSFLLGIDNGCTVAKAALFTAEGRELAVASRSSRMLPTRPGWAEFDMERLWLGAAEAVREVLQRSRVDPRRIACVSCTGHGNGLYLVDAEGNPVRNAIGSADSRARDYIDRWTRDDVLSRIRHKTMQAIWPAQPNALLRWLADHEPDSIARARWILMCKDFVRARLTGEIWMERSDMSGTSLMNVGTGQYDNEVLEAWGLAGMGHMLPPLRDSADLCGTITSQAAAATGLAEGTPVAAGLFDIDACGLASGMVDGEALTMIAGTWGNNEYIARQPVVSGDVFMTSCYSIPGYYLVLEGSATSASNLEWFAAQFLQAEQADAAAQGRSVYDLCNELVAGTGPRDSGILFLPFLYGSNVSLDGKACLFGLDGWQTRGHVLRAVYEGIVFSHKWHVDRLLQFRAMPASIRLTGGAARSEIWTQMFADVFGVPVQVPEGTELGALGAAICGAVASGIYEGYEQACAAMVRFARIHPPDQELADCYRAKYDRYLRMLEVMRPAWSELAWKTP
ncbi:MAG: FGGY-family carbohydrate kinase [Thermoguttaceae bacterium]